VIGEANRIETTKTVRSRWWFRQAQSGARYTACGRTRPGSPATSW